MKTSVSDKVLLDLSRRARDEEIKIKKKVQDIAVDSILLIYYSEYRHLIPVAVSSSSVLGRRFYLRIDMETGGESSL